MKIYSAILGELLKFKLNIMKNYLVVKDGFETVIQSKYLYQNLETGQTVFWRDSISNPTAILPKEAIVIETADLTEYQKTLQNIISDLQIVRHNDRERELQEYDTLDFWKKEQQLSWLKAFEKLYEQTL